MSRRADQAETLLSVSGGFWRRTSGLSLDVGRGTSRLRLWSEPDSRVAVRLLIEGRAWTAQPWRYNLLEWLTFEPNGSGRLALGFGQLVAVNVTFVYSVPRAGALHLTYIDSPPKMNRTALGYTYRRRPYPPELKVAPGFLASARLASCTPATKCSMFDSAGNIPAHLQGSMDPRTCDQGRAPAARISLGPQGEGAQR